MLRKKAKVIELFRPAFEESLQVSVQLRKVFAVMRLYEAVGVIRRVHEGRGGTCDIGLPSG